MNEQAAQAQALQSLQAYLAQRYPAEGERLQALAQQLSEDADPFSRSNMRGHITTSALVLDLDAQRVLLIHHKTFERWLQPGGHFEPSEGSADPLLASALREVVEETGVGRLRPHPQWLDPATGLALPFDIDSHAIPANPRKQEGAHWHHDYAYLLLADSRAAVPSPQLAEVHAAAWLPLAQLATLPDARMRLLGAKLAVWTGELRVTD
jgi:8-oxo-dGTP pyrophosphatase MutT (NUDIX family)